MAKKSLEQKIDALTNIVEKGFAAVADDISKLATKDQIIALHTQVNSIETDIRDMKHTKLHALSPTSRKKSSAQPATNHRPTTVHPVRRLSHLRH